MENLLRIKESFYREHNPNFKIITNDFHNINRRIKNIDKSLFLVYNGFEEKYEIHDLRNQGSTYVLSFKDVDKEILITLNKAKDRDTVKYIREEHEKQKRYNNDKKDRYTKDISNFARNYETEIFTK
jgi:hypothetical protein